MQVSTAPGARVTEPLVAEPATPAPTKQPPTAESPGRASLIETLCKVVFPALVAVRV